MADIIASEGYLQAGYSMVSLDDCWLARSRDAQGRLQPDPLRFPSGIRALADYLDPWTTGHASLVAHALNTHLLLLNKGIEIWARPITPVDQNYYSYAIAFLNRRTDGTPSEVSVKPAELGMTYPNGYTVTDLFSGVKYGLVNPKNIFKADVNPSGVVLLRWDLAASHDNEI
ncbi:hypothetical protein HAZT_HAZT004337 [Hyalella azteca]|uniref:Alpha galactosidase A C-terminal domain-containing protein n=1 Tax=Hyalella azteca TaxID=294128 RepID=A0A6A0H8C6_HYAAZ|nr:hypothetical protein HAZT_HAZT004337 [Hyalella azteca]